MKVKGSSHLLLGMMTKPTPSGYTGSTSMRLGRCLPMKTATLGEVPSTVRWTLDAYL
jgi:hypothetical protein